MKNLNTKLIVLLTAISLLGVGCSKSGGGSSDTPIADTSATAVVAPDGLGGTTSSSGITFTPVSKEVMASYVASHPLNDPSNYVMTVNLTDVGGGKYGGTVTLGYDDNGQRYLATFKLVCTATVSTKSMNRTELRKITM